MKRIVVLMHHCRRLRHTYYLIDALSEAWRQKGLRVSCVYGLNHCPKADLVIPHIDLTRTPPEYNNYIRSLFSVINRDVLDISKRASATHLLLGDEDYRGPVIVKTDTNSHGRQEYRLFRCRHPLLARVQRKAVPVAERALGHRLAWRTVLHEYRIYDSLADVPSGAFANPALVIQRFLPEREGDRYFVRHYLCLGDASRSVRVAASTPLLKRVSCVLVDEDLPVPDQVLSLRRRLRLDYGKIDYTIHAGEVAILDVNRTPGVPGPPEATARTVADLADGIWSLMPNGR